MEQKYTLRKLKTKDIFKMSKILGKIEIDFKSVNVDGLSQVQAGIAMVKLVLENIWKAEDEVNDFVGSLVGFTGEEFADLDFEDTMEIFKQFAELKGIADFLSSANKQTKKK